MLTLGNSNLPGCKNSQSYTDYQNEGVLGCGWGVAYPYFISYILLVRLTILNLLLAVVIEGFSESKKESDAVINPEQLDQFLEKWAEYDPKGTGLVRPEEFLFIIHDLYPPVGLREESTLKYTYDLDCNNEFFFH